MTGPYHAILSLYGILDTHNILKERVLKSKNTVMREFREFILSKENQPLLCTYLNGKVVPCDENIVLYSPRSNLPGSIICHLGEIHKDHVSINNRVTLENLT